MVFVTSPVLKVPSCEYGEYARSYLLPASRLATSTEESAVSSRLEVLLLYSWCFIVVSGLGESWCPVPACVVLFFCGGEGLRVSDLELSI